MAFIANIIESNQFDYNSNNMQFFAEISSMPEVMGQLYDDACDIGFGIRSAKTGTVVYFCLSNNYRVDGCDGEILEWVFKSIDRNPILRKLSVVIAND